MRKTSGVSLMLLIFLSLCLIIFSLLSLSGAVADETLSSQAADRTTEYYAAVTTANDLLAQIDEQLAEYLREAEASNVPETAAQKDGSDDSEDQSAEQRKRKYSELCSRIGSDVPGVSREDAEDGSTDTGNGMVSFTVDVDDEQILQVRLDIAYPSSDDDPLYRIHTWKVVNTNEWNADNSMNLFRSKDKKEY